MKAAPLIFPHNSLILMGAPLTTNKDYQASMCVQEILAGIILGKPN